MGNLWRKRERGNEEKPDVSFFPPIMSARPNSTIKKNRFDPSVRLDVDDNVGTAAYPFRASLEQDRVFPPAVEPTVEIFHVVR
jgi:hypothetical protein